MDPQESWRSLLDAWANRNWDEVRGLSDDLLAWLNRSGFPPTILFPRRMGAEFDWAVARAACEFTRARAIAVLDDPFRIPRDIPFSLACKHCECSGPVTDAEARTLGWKDIEYVPDSTMECFLGVCRSCCVRAGRDA